MNYPLAALAFAAIVTATLGTVATIVGGPVAPLPLFALILVGIEFGVLIKRNLMLIYFEGNSYDASNIMACVCNSSFRTWFYSSWT